MHAALRQLLCNAASAILDCKLRPSSLLQSSRAIRTGTRRRRECVGPKQVQDQGVGYMLMANTSVHVLTTGGCLRGRPHPRQTRRRRPLRSDVVHRLWVNESHKGGWSPSAVTAPHYARDTVFSSGWKVCQRIWRRQPTEEHWLRVWTCLATQPG